MVHTAFEKDKLCPELPRCELNCDLVKDESGCSICACQSTSNSSSASLSPQRHQQNSSVTSSNRTLSHPNVESFENDDDKKIVCPEVKCDLHCEHGLMMDENDCTLCECKPLHEDCPPFVGCKKKCRFGYRTNKRGCPVKFFYYFLRFIYFPFFFRTSTLNLKNYGIEKLMTILQLSQIN